MGFTSSSTALSGIEIIRGSVTKELILGRSCMKKRWSRGSVVTPIFHEADAPTAMMSNRKEACTPPRFATRMSYFLDEMTKGLTLHNNRSN